MRKIFITFLAISSIFAVSTKKIYNVDGMMCGVGCVNIITNTLKTLEGVEEFSIDFSTKRMEILFDTENLTSEKVISTLPNPYKVTFIKETTEKEYAISGMTCMGCVNSIRASIQDLEGLENYVVDFEKDMLYIEFDVQKTDEKKILNKIPEKFKVVELVSIEEEKVEKETAEEEKVEEEKVEELKN